MSALPLTVLPARLAVARLDPGTAVPDWAWSGELCSITRTEGELSVVCDEAAVPPDVRAERGWRAIRVEGPLDFTLTGVLAALATTLAGAGVSIFAISTYDTDYVLVRDPELATARAALTETGHAVG